MAWPGFERGRCFRGLDRNCHCLGRCSDAFCGLRSRNRLRPVCGLFGGRVNSLDRFDHGLGRRFGWDLRDAVRRHGGSLFGTGRRRLRQVGLHRRRAARRPAGLTEGDRNAALFPSLEGAQSKDLE